MEPQLLLLLQVIAVDEAQFFPDLLDFCTHAADRDAKLVLVAGLDGDFRRRQFGQVWCDWLAATGYAGAERTLSVGLYDCDSWGSFSRP